MGSIGSLSWPAALMLALGTSVAVSIDVRNLDRGQEMAEDCRRARTTAPAVLNARNTDKLCGTGLRMCPSSVSGGCCPDAFSCGTDSCYATSRAPSTCGTLVGWHACDAVHGGSCCPDGWECDTADRCVPPSRSAYTFGCPVNHYLCTSSQDYGCCPTEMACGMNRCYSTAATTITNVIDFTTTRDGERTVIQSTSITVRSPTLPTAVATVNMNEQDDQAVFKYFPSAVAKVSPTTEPEDDNTEGGDSSSGLTKAQLGGIVAGAVIFLVIILLVAFFIIRKLNAAVAVLKNNTGSKQSNGTKPQPAMRQFGPTDSEIDALSIDPLMMSPQPSMMRHDSSDPRYQFGQSIHAPGSTDPTPSSLAGGYHQVTPVHSRHASLDVAGNVIGYFDPGPSRPVRTSQGSGTTPQNDRVSTDSQQIASYMRVRNWSNGSDLLDDVFAQADSNGVLVSELDGTPCIAELAGSQGSVSPMDDRRRSSGSGSGTGVVAKLSHHRRRSEASSTSRAEGTPPPSMLGVVSEEIHGFHGLPDRMAGQTAHLPATRAEEIWGSENESSDGTERER
ncbi:hypothetical protein NLU13_4423 [Sarocladium strictum]|uniref:Uncharacterized protein n=1 Tax=Sarocladium strictum TaxID=5046 RepID=A0AA39GIU5_SARSR|nr:hypothetical protein NLU13_4423 [Sarocladium strictum]